MSREGMTLSRIAVDGSVWSARQRLLDLGLCRLGNELILLGKMHQQGRMEIANLAQILLSFTPVIGDCSVNPVTHSRQEGHKRPEAVAKYGDLAGALGHLGHAAGRILDVPDTGLSVIG